MIKIAIIGTGDISGIYLQNLTTLFKEVQVIGVCDLVKEKAMAAQQKYGIAKLYATMDEAFSDDEVNLVLNLTRPYEHFDVSMAALKAGKHVYSEKPLATTLADGEALVQYAEDKGLSIGAAPDTFMGAGIATCKKLIEDGYIGEVIGATASMICRGHEGWHPDPEFYYLKGGGPMLDMGPYYVTALVHLLGKVKEVKGVSRTTFKERVIGSEGKKGQIIHVEVPTYITGIMTFESGAIGTLFTTFDVYSTSQARLEIYGSEGSLIVPDPNTFGGPIQLLRREESAYKEIPLCFGYSENSRGLGVVDMARSIETGEGFKANGRQALHVLKVMLSFTEEV